MRAKLTVAAFVVVAVAYALGMASGLSGVPLHLIGDRVADTSAQADRLGD